jgi:hypothetical protein
MLMAMHLTCYENSMAVQIRRDDYDMLTAHSSLHMLGGTISFNAIADDHRRITSLSMNSP